MTGKVRVLLYQWGLNTRTLVLNVFILLCLIPGGNELRRLFLIHGKTVSPTELLLLFLYNSNTRLVLIGGMIMNLLDGLVPDEKAFFVLLRGDKRSFASAALVCNIVKNMLYLFFIMAGLILFFAGSIAFTSTWGSGIRLISYNSPLELGISFVVNIPPKARQMLPWAVAGVHALILTLGTAGSVFWCGICRLLGGRIAAWLPVVLFLVLEELLRVDLLPEELKYISLVHLLSGNDYLWGLQMKTGISLGILSVFSLCGFFLFRCCLERMDLE